MLNSIYGIKPQDLSSFIAEHFPAYRARQLLDWIYDKLIFDTELAKDRWFAAFNVLYEIERVLEQGETEWEKGSKLGLALATTFRVRENCYLGFNAQ